MEEEQKNFVVVLKSEGKPPEKFLREMENLMYNRPYQEGSKVIWGDKTFDRVVK